MSYGFSFSPTKTSSATTASLQTDPACGRSCRPRRDRRENPFHQRRCPKLRRPKVHRPHRQRWRSFRNATGIPGPTNSNVPSTLTPSSARNAPVGRPPFCACPQCPSVNGFPGAFSIALSPHLPVAYRTGQVHPILPICQENGRPPTRVTPSKTPVSRNPCSLTSV
jgi:hypothetical protein